MVICGVYAVAAAGTSRADSSDSLWSAAPWLGAVLACGVLVHLGIRLLAPRSNEILAGLVGLLVGLGWVFVARIDVSLAQSHALAVAAGSGAMLLTLLAMRRLDWLLRRPGTSAILAAGMLAAAGLGAGGVDTSGGSYVPPSMWLDVGIARVQPGSLAKLLLVIAACGLTISAPRWLPPRLGPHRHAVGAIVAAIGAWTVLVTQQDYGLSFVIFAAAWLPLWLDGSEARNGDLRVMPLSTRTRALGGVAATYGAGLIMLATVYDPLSVQVRHWLNPWASPETSAVSEASFAFAAGGITGVGPGLGSPDRIAAAHSDFVLAVIGEELGILGAAGVLAAFMLIIGIGAGIAQRARGTNRLLAASVTVVVGLQAMLSIAGVLQVLPATAVAAPFIAHGPAALIGNCIAVAMLLALSDSDVGARLGRGAPGVPDPPDPPGESAPSAATATGELSVAVDVDRRRAAEPPPAPVGPTPRAPDGAES